MRTRNKLLRQNWHTHTHLRTHDCNGNCWVAVVICCSHIPSRHGRILNTSNVTSAATTQMEVNRNHWNMHSLLRIIEHYSILWYFFVKQIARFGRLQRNHFFSVLPKCNKKEEKTAKRLTLLLPIKCFICSCICRCDANAIELQLMSNAPSKLIWYFLLHLLFVVADAWWA